MITKYEWNKINSNNNNGTQKWCYVQHSTVVNAKRNVLDSSIASLPCGGLLLLSGSPEHRSRLPQPVAEVIDRPHAHALLPQSRGSQRCFTILRLKGVADNFEGV